LNAAQAQAFGQGLQGAALNNQAQSQRFSQDAENLRYNNDTRQQDMDNRNAQISGWNQNLNQGFSQDFAGYDASRAQRQQSMEEQFALRSQPINEISALLSGSQVNAPNFNIAQPSQIANTDYAGIVNENHNQRMQIAQGEYNARQSLFGGALGLGASLLF
jgi:hypothetical protein